MVTVKEFYAQPKNYKIQKKLDGVWEDVLNGKAMRKGEADIFLKANKVMRGTNAFQDLRKVKLKQKLKEFGY